MKFSAATKKLKIKKYTKKQKREEFDSSTVVSSEEYYLNHRQVKCILYRECSHSTGKCKDLCAMVNKYKQTKRNISSSMERATRNLMC